MIWSIIPEEVIFGEVLEETALRQGSYLGRQVMLRPCEDGKGEIVSVMSTNPLDFLDSRLQPGTRVPME